MIEHPKLRRTYLGVVWSIPIDNVKVFALLRIHSHTTGFIDTIADCA